MIPRVIELTEYQTRFFQKEDLTEETVKTLHGAYHRQIAVEPPSFLNENRWQLTPQGWTGYIPLDEDIHFALRPKVPVRNLFRMLEYAYNIKFEVLEGAVDSGSITEFYDRLACILAKRILDRLRHGLYRSYLRHQDLLPYLRGRLDLLAHIRDPVRPMLPCRFEEHTPDLAENQILLWTLTRILSSGVCTERSLPFVRQARRALLGFVRPEPFSADSCVNRLYNRLNEDYQPMHTLCRFFLEHTGPTHHRGDHRMLPILVNMGTLFERFVFEWLKCHVPEPYTVRGQDDVQFHMGQPVSIQIDITVEDISEGRTVMVLDTKYKSPERPAVSDIQQVVAYALAKGCERAVLVYPATLEGNIDGTWGDDIHVESLAFDLGGNLDKSGAEFLANLFPNCHLSPV